MQGKAPLDSHPLTFLCPTPFAADVRWEKWLISHSHRLNHAQKNLFGKSTPILSHSQLSHIIATSIS
jgi:hypothetical protein